MLLQPDTCIELLQHVNDDSKNALNICNAAVCDISIYRVMRLLYDLVVRTADIDVKTVPRQRTKKECVEMK
ncbi:unnamed protein product [Heligmosomoides polygyrus]|uniref:NPH3 domain-containing protein n=1 Tax=Heligmosomoides polygyrus TaxID=6339 RepID=A0A183GSY7_HELPZ|nr:unnamed protein product [Heligmosomoides polygyrus]